MRPFARALMRPKAQLRAVHDAANDAAIRERLNRSMRRRMSDDLVALIRRACICGHAETAKGLWVVLRDLTAREARQRYPNGRLPEPGLLDTLALEIAAAADQDKPSAR